jgi:hypothetical protein
VQQLLLFSPPECPAWLVTSRAGAGTVPGKNRPRRAVAQRQNKGAWPALATTVVFRKARMSRDSLSVATESWLPASTTS